MWNYRCTQMNTDREKRRVGKLRTESRRPLQPVFLLYLCSSVCICGSRSLRRLTLRVPSASSAFSAVKPPEASHADDVVASIDEEDLAGDGARPVAGEED